MYETIVSKLICLEISNRRRWVHGALGGGHYEAEPIVVERAAVIDVDRLGGLGTGVRAPS